VFFGVFGTGCLGVWGVLFGRVFGGQPREPSAVRLVDADGELWTKSLYY